MKLALDGGTPLRQSPYPPWPQYDDTEREALGRALDQGQWWRVGGSEVTSFEAEFGAYHGGTALAVTNGTHALELALEIIGLEPGDEVIVPAFTFISTSMAVQRLGGVPVPVDVDRETYCLDPTLLEAARTPRTRAVMPVHMAGHVVDMDAVGAWADGHGITLIQDAAHAPGAVWQGKRIGDFGTLACFSFQNGKLMTAGEGGALLLPDPDGFEEAFTRHSCGRPPRDTVYVHRTASSNFRMSEFSGAVLRAQLGRLESHTLRREAQWKVLSAALGQIPGVWPQGRDPRSELNPYYMAMFTIDPDAYPGVSRDLVVQALVAEGVPAFVNYPPVYRTDAFWSRRAGGGDDVTAMAERCPASEAIGARGVWLHHRVLLGDDADCADTAEALVKVLTGLQNRTAAS
ncbi:MAG: DegT/DnrJ/EryC1/StrS family aminotransferase [Actinocatenispora sp.]